MRLEFRGMVFFGGSFHFLSAVVVSDVTVPHDLFSESVSSFQVSSENMVKYGRRKIARVEMKNGNFGKNCQSIGYTYWR